MCKHSKEQAPLNSNFHYEGLISGEGTTMTELGTLNMCSSLLMCIGAKWERLSSSRSGVRTWLDGYHVAYIE